MFSNLINKTFYDKRWFLLGWSVGIVSLIALTIVFFPSLSKGQNLEQLFQNVPKQLQSLVGDVASYRTITGYIASGIFELRIPMLTLPMGIILAINLGITEESNGQLYQLLAQPISRPKVVVQKWLTMLGIISTVFIAFGLSIFAVVALIGEHAANLKVVQLLVISWFLTIAAASLTYMFGMATGKRGLAIALGSLATFGSYLITSFATQVEWLKNIDYLSLFHYYHPSIIIKSGLSLSHLLVFSSISLISLIIATIGFSNRDIGV